MAGVQDLLPTPSQYVTSALPAVQPPLPAAGHPPLLGCGHDVKDKLLEAPSLAQSDCRDPLMAVVLGSGLELHQAWAAGALST
jgi:hypothetical protein